MLIATILPRRDKSEAFSGFDFLLLPFEFTLLELLYYTYIMYRKIILWSILLLFLLGLLTGFNWYWQESGSKDNSTAAEQAAALASGMAKVRQWERLVEADPPRGGREFDAEFSATELTAIIRDAELKKDDPVILPASLNVSIVDQEIMVFGVVRRPINFPLTVILTAGVKDGRLVPEIVSARLGWWRFSSNYIVKLANEIFGMSWQTDINRLSFSWDELSINDNRLYFAGRTTGKFYKQATERE